MMRRAQRVAAVEEEMDSSMRPPGMSIERYDLAIRKQHLDLPAIQTLLDTLSRSGFRRELESLGGYDARIAGQRLL